MKYKYFSFQYWSLIVCGLLFNGCAGPSTPLGAIWALIPSQAHGASFSQEESTKAEPFPKIRFSPSRQILHGPSPLRVIVEDDEIVSDDPTSLQVSYDDLDVSGSFLMRSRVSVSPSHEELIFEHPPIRLSPDAEHRIEVTYRSPSGKIARASYEAPSCRAFGKDPVLRLERMITRISLEYGISPAFSTALVAQESAFNPRAVSWAKAVGLTQITPIAEQEVARQFTDWPRYPGLNDMPVPLLKAMILFDQVNSKNEWRLDKERSIRGGLDYAISLARHWSTVENAETIRRIAATDPETERTRLILASYHSGYARVSSAVGRGGAAWLSDEDLSEARRYVNRVFSYCYSFSDTEAANEDSP